MFPYLIAQQFRHDSHQNKLILRISVMTISNKSYLKTFFSPKYMYFFPWYST